MARIIVPNRLVGPGGYAVAGSGTVGSPLLFGRNYGTLNGNWDGIEDDYDGILSSKTLVPGGGPSGRDAVEWAMIYDATPPEPEVVGGQFDWGWSEVLADAPSGESRFVRGYVWFDPDSNFRCLDWGEPHDPHVYGNKYVFHGNDGSDNRAILNINGAGFDVNGLEFEITGPSDYHAAVGESSTTYPLGQWHAWQWEVRYGPGAYVKLWVNNDTYASPTLFEDGLSVTPVSGNGDVRQGAFCNYGLDSDGIVIFRDSAFEVGQTFKSNWHASM